MFDADFCCWEESSFYYVKRTTKIKKINYFCKLAKNKNVGF